MPSGHSVLFGLSEVTEFIKVIGFIKVTEFSKVVGFIKVTEFLRVTEFIRPIGGHELFGAMLLPMSSYCSLFRVRVSVSFCASVLERSLFLVGFCVVLSLWLLSGHVL